MTTILADLPDIHDDNTDRLSQVISAVNGYPGQGIHFNLTEFRDDDKHQSRWRNKGVDGLHVAAYLSDADLETDDPIFEIVDAEVSVSDVGFFVRDAGSIVLQVDGDGIQVGAAYPVSIYGTLTVSGAAVFSVDALVGRDLTVGRDLHVVDDITVDDDASITGDLNVTGSTTLVNVSANALTLTGVGTALLVNYNALIQGTLSVIGLSTLGAVNATSLTLDGAGTALTVNNNALISGALTVNGATVFGDANADTHTQVGVTTFRNAASSAIQLFIDAANNRAIFGANAALSGATDDKVTVSGGALHIAANSSSTALGIRYSTTGTGVVIGATANSNPDLIFAPGGTETFRVGNSASVFQAKVTGDLSVTSDAVIGANLTADSISVLTSGLQVIAGGITVTAGGATISAGNLAVTTGGISAGAASTFTGGVTLTNSILTLTGGQIAFPSTQVASSDANTLDDYEEGPWTPVLVGTATYTTQVGRYTKIGRLVTIQGELQINAMGTSVSTSVINGLPFTAAVASAINIGYWATSVTAYVYLSGYISGTSITLYSTAAAAASLAAASFWQAGARIVFHGSYIV